MSADVDLVEFYKRMPDYQRKAYWSLNLHEYGFENEHERPLVYVMSHLDDQVYVSEPTGSGISRSYVDVDWYDSAYLEEEDFLVLIEEVPWLQPEYMIPEEDRARTPGPLDVPLFEA